MRTYKGLIGDLKENEIAIIGVNEIGVNGNPVKGTGGAALWALNKGYIEQGEILDNKLSQSGKVWGLTTVTYPGRKRSKTLSEIGNGVVKVYNYAENNPDKLFYVVYSAKGRNLNGYSSEELAKVFSKNTPPANIIFEEEFAKLMEL